MEKFNDLRSLQIFVTDVGLVLVAKKAGAISDSEALALITEKSVALLPDKFPANSGLDPDVAKVEASWKNDPTAPTSSSTP